jgi:hypothetical protein
MNTPTTEEINGVLDPLLGRLYAVCNDSLCTIQRQFWFGKNLEWRASASEYAALGASPTEAVVNLIALRPEQIAKRRAKLEAELAALETPKETPALRDQIEALNIAAVHES